MTGPSRRNKVQTKSEKETPRRLRKKTLSGLRSTSHGGPNKSGGDCEDETRLRQRNEMKLNRVGRTENTRQQNQMKLNRRAENTRLSAECRQKNGTREMRPTQSADFVDSRPEGNEGE